MDHQLLFIESDELIEVVELFGGGSPDHSVAVDQVDVVDEDEVLVDEVFARR